MEINAKAPATARHEIVINASRETIWQVLTDIDQWPTWCANVSASRLEGALQPHSTFQWKAGGTQILSTLQEVVPQQRLSWAGKAIGTRAIHVWILEPHEKGILVRTEESFEGWLVSLLKGMMQRMLDTSLQSWLEELKLKSEAIDSKLQVD
ncbi:MAG TPA: SRPBCC family protein [Coleofasciculaceae cyanobacterium]|jgi:uncharacterized protein YndB with AHSA1/START domain